MIKAAWIAGNSFGSFVFNHKNIKICESTRATLQTANGKLWKKPFAASESAGIRCER
jgi:hypothetical protein